MLLNVSVQVSKCPKKTFTAETTPRPHHSCGLDGGPARVAADRRRRRAAGRALAMRGLNLGSGSRLADFVSGRWLRSASAGQCARHMFDVVCCCEVEVRWWLWVRTDERFQILGWDGGKTEFVKKQNNIQNL